MDFYPESFIYIIFKIYNSLSDYIILKIYDNTTTGAISIFTDKIFCETINFKIVIVNIRIKMWLCDCNYVKFVCKVLKKI